VIRLPLLLALLPLGACCGYQPGGLYETRDVRVEVFDNVGERRGHEFDLTGAVVQEMISRGIRVNRRDAPVILKGRIEEIRTPPLVNQADTDQLLVGSLYYRVEVRLLQTDGQERWKDERVESVSYTPGRGESAETARREMVDRLARWVVTRLEKEW
jgi:hypothetical protein